MKRVREDGEIVERLAMANCLMLLSQNLEAAKRRNNLPANEPVFECKTCNRKFPSFQALGGHRASHKRPKLMGDKANGENKSLNTTMKPKLHECTICGQEFALGQALGGHMRRHRATINDDLASATIVSKVPVLTRSNSRRIFGLDLNLTPLENDLELLFGKMAPKVNLSIFN